MTYRGLVENILQFNVTASCGNLNVKDKNEFSKIVNIAGKVIKSTKPQNRLADVSDSVVLREARQISGDASHPINSESELLSCCVVLLIVYF